MNHESKQDVKSGPERTRRARRRPPNRPQLAPTGSVVECGGPPPLWVWRLGSGGVSGPSPASFPQRQRTCLPRPDALRRSQAAHSKSLARLRKRRSCPCDSPRLSVVPDLELRLSVTAHAAAVELWTTTNLAAGLWEPEPGPLLTNWLLITNLHREQYFRLKLPVQ